MKLTQPELTDITSDISFSFVTTGIRPHYCFVTLIDAVGIPCCAAIRVR